MPDLEINIQFSANAQSLKASSGEIMTLGEDFARMVTDEVAIGASDEAFQRARRTFVRGVKTAIQAEVSRMASLIGRFLPLPDKYTGPNGEMSLSDGMSATARLMGFPQTFNRKQTDISWSARSSRYLRWKRNHEMPARWWEAHGDLRKEMAAKTGKFYEDAFGPVRVRFEKAAIRDQRGRFAKRGVNTLAVNPGDIEGGASKRVNVTASGRQGRIASEYQVGTLEVDVFGKITPSMLPGLPRMDPTKADAFPGEGLVGLFPNDGPGGVRNKLLGTRKGSHYRYAVEPFVSFFLMRAIPNAVWNRTEKLISS